MQQRASAARTGTGRSDGIGQTAVRPDATNRRDTASAITATDAERRHRWDPAGKRLHLAIVEIPDKTARERFQAAALDALDEMLLGAGGEL